MLKSLLRYFVLLVMLLFSTSVFALDYSKLPEIVKINIEKQYNGEEIQIISVKKEGYKFIVIIQTEFGKDKVVVNKKGKILSISDYLEGLEPSGGC